MNSLYLSIMQHHDLDGMHQGLLWLEGSMGALQDQVQLPIFLTLDNKGRKEALIDRLEDSSKLCDIGEDRDAALDARDAARAAVMDPFLFKFKNVEDMNTFMANMERRGVGLHCCV